MHCSCCLNGPDYACAGHIFINVCVMHLPQPCADHLFINVCVMQPPSTRRRKSRRNSTRSLRNAPGPLTRQLTAASLTAGATTPAQTTPRLPRRQMSEGSLSGSDTASLASGDSGMTAASVCPLADMHCHCCMSQAGGYTRHAYCDQENATSVIASEI